MHASMEISGRYLAKATILVVRTPPPVSNKNWLRKFISAGVCVLSTVLYQSHTEARTVAGEGGEDPTTIDVTPDLSYDQDSGGQEGRR